MPVKRFHRWTTEVLSCIEPNIRDLLDSQINKELHSAYLYPGIARSFDARKLHGFAHWYVVQAEDETEHGKKIFDYLPENNEDITFPAIDAISSEYGSALEAVKAADAHEHYITDEIDKIIFASAEAKDIRTRLFLTWFVTEQEEEEKNSGDMVDKVTMPGEDPKNLYLLDQELAKREYYFTWIRRIKGRAEQSSCLSCFMCPVSFFHEDSALHDETGSTFFRKLLQCSRTDMHDQTSL